MSDPSKALLDKADRAIHAAQILRSEGDSDFAVGRAYYAMLYAAEALLISKGYGFESMAVCMRPSASTSPKTTHSILSCTAGSWMPTINEFWAIMA